ncbi:hypothetical protein [Pseudoalteromonas luteoviolacea]|uniref:Uncharacterized protein n=1 Tax=Pseudoalteromonas luteoviolacea S4060-1 TaxID=1365257 RepID=A0A162B6L2_9GAMM|nr:hypothetical protein [Pseudoalteromonas luteoviolacea]KZN67291.1 hypothetical protein N478_17870 [Pseudoalteromonas luteoviolacea S4060-1]
MSNFIKLDGVVLSNVELPDSFVIYKNKPLTDLDFTNPEFERYGGRSISNHGGGARAANYGNYQVKGVGLTPLAGEIKGSNYSHGTVPLLEALVEAVYSEVLKNVLPVGVAGFHGVICTGSNTAFEFDEAREGELKATQGALFIREKCERPAHYLRAYTFKVKPEYKDVVEPDLERIRRVIKTLADECGSPEGFLEFVAGFLQGCAEQFGFARVAGITHGAMTPSNILMDGGWIDLVTPTFVDRGRNYRVANLTYYQEPTIALEVSQEMCDTYAKFNQVTFDTSILHDYYTSSLDMSIDYHMPYIFGLDRDVVESLELNGKAAELFGKFKKALNKESRVYFTGSLGNETSNTFKAPLIAVFTQALNDKRSVEYDLYHAAYIQYEHKAQVTFEAFVVQCFIKAMKRDLLSALYFRTHVEDNIEKSLEQGGPHCIQNLIDAYRLSAMWVFDDELNKEEIIYQSTNGLSRYVFDGVTLKVVSGIQGSERPVSALSCEDISCEFFQTHQDIFLRYFDTVSTVIGGVVGE